MADGAGPDDAELIERARGGDQQAFRMIVERYEGKVAATVIGMVGRGADADDVGQETFIRLYRSLDQFRGEAALGTYLTRIAINQALKALNRRKSWMQRFFSRDDDTVFVDEPAMEEPSELDEKERKALIESALARLSPEHRAVVVLRMLEEHSTREVAEMLGIPEGTVMSRLSRALEKMERTLAPLLRGADDT
jgi:RNA polymerase sigma-70 factor, ECF subfamily